MNNRTLLKTTIALAACVPVSAGLYGMLCGTDMLGARHDNAALDSHVRYLSGLLFGIGVAFWNLIPTIERRRKEVLLLTLIVFLGGLARLYGALFVAMPSLPMQLALVMELIVTPALCVWQGFVARQHDNA